MPFVESSDSIRSKLHLSDVSTPVLVGALACIVAVAFLLVSHAVQLAASSDLEVTPSEEAPNDTDESVAAEEPEPLIKVHIDGCVNNPGVYELRKDMRVQDAVECAGGFTSDADTSAVNLARIVNDGEQVLIPSKQPAVSEVTPSQGSTGAASNGVPPSADSSTQSQSQTGSGQNALVNINTADASLLQTLPGVGESTAQKIIDSRASEGPFISKEDIKRVSGIGDKKFKKLEARICV